MTDRFTHLDEAGAVEREAHRARAVVARVRPVLVPAAEAVREVRDDVARGDDRGDRRGCAGGGDGEAVAAGGVGATGPVLIPPT